MIWVESLVFVRIAGSDGRCWRGGRGEGVVGMVSMVGVVAL
jgi:hypothetical protein